MSYRVLIWCDDCYLQNNHGCFNGQAIAKNFELFYEAKTWANKFIKDHFQWNYEIKELTNESSTHPTKPYYLLNDL